MLLGLSMFTMRSQKKIYFCRKNFLGNIDYIMLDILFCMMAAFEYGKLFLKLLRGVFLERDIFP